MSNSGYSASERRIQLKAPDDVIARLLDPKLGTKLRQALTGSMEINPALERIINDEAKAKRVTILLQILFGALDNMEAGQVSAANSTQAAVTTPVVKPVEQSKKPTSGKPAPDFNDLQG